jgi:hypothetical protein
VRHPEKARVCGPFTKVGKKDARGLGVTSIYVPGIDPDEIIDTVHSRRPPMISASVGLAPPPPR